MSFGKIYIGVHKLGRVHKGTARGGVRGGGQNKVEKFRATFCDSKKLEISKSQIISRTSLNYSEKLSTSLNF